ncbi:MAG: HIT domain-containing protein [Planctomycetes bacterium]|nr:HIT domain-containing protein [Planctomycetota bacterium]
MERLWAPWRMTYINNIEEEKKEGCFFCNAFAETGREVENLVVGRGRDAFIMLNRFPYSNAHLLIAPARHFGTMEEATDAEGAELWRLTTLAKKALSNAFSPHGFNVGINQGRVAGAGVLDHLHLHIVPRWDGDINFMPVFADVKIIPQALEETRNKLAPYVEELLAGSRS